MIEKKTFEVRSRGYAQEFKSDVPWAAISIITEHPWPNLLEENRVDLLQLEFWDISTSAESLGLRGEGILSFEEDHATQILDFVHDMWDQVECFLIHCDAGLSRSPAVAAAIERIYYEDDQYWFNTKTPNMLVYRKLLDVHHEKYSESVE